MRIEHKLSPAVTAYARRSIEQLKQLRTQHLIALGQAKEAELQHSLVQQALAQHLAVIEESEHLPASSRPYVLSEDGSMLIGEVEDNAAMIPAYIGSNGNG